MNESRRLRAVVAAAVFLLLGFLFFRYTRTKASAFLLAFQEKEAPCVALTFDDGPDSETTEKLLDGLKKRKIKASFFLIGKNIEGNEALVRRMHEEGHLIGNHTYDHVQLSCLSMEEACSQLAKTNRLIYEITGENPSYVRPPFGAWKEGLDREMTMLPVMWDVDPLDWKTQDVQSVVSHVKQRVKDGDIILLHDIYDTSVEAAFLLIDELTEENYRFVTADELLSR